MLNILFGKETEDTNICPDVYFNNTYEVEWFNDEIVKNIIKDIDRSEVQGLNIISPVLGSISVERLSGGCKTLILLYKDDEFEPNLTWLGDNCEGWLVKIANMKDIRAVMTGLDLKFRGFNNLNFKCLNDGDYINSDVEWCSKCLKYNT